MHSLSILRRRILAAAARLRVLPPLLARLGVGLAFVQTGVDGAGRLSLDTLVARRLESVDADAGHVTAIVTDDTAAHA